MAPEYETGRYRRQERLSADSEVWLAEDLEDTGSQVVIKVLPETADVIAARHLREMLAGLDDPAVNPPVDEGELPDGRIFLVYPWIPGTTLREFLNTGGPLSFGAAAAILSQVGDALTALHNKHVIYGVLSPEHVIVQQSRGRISAALLNTGVFRITGETSASPGYLAPEQLAGSPALSSDVFSLGALAAELLTGRRAFRYGSLEELARMQRIGLSRGSLRKFRGKIPVRVEEEIRRATSWDPIHRPSGPDTFSEKLAETLGSGAGLPVRRMILMGLACAALGVTGLRKCGARR